MGQDTSSGTQFISALHEDRKTAPIDGPYEYVTADVTIDGVKFEKVGLRKKGFIGSQSTSRPSLKIKLNHTNKKAKIGGLTNLTMNNNKQDSTIVSQVMGYALFNAAGSPAPRTAFAKVTVNGKNHGVYTHVETVRKMCRSAALAMTTEHFMREQWWIFIMAGKAASNAKQATTKRACAAN